MGGSRNAYGLWAECNIYRGVVYCRGVRTGCMAWLGHSPLQAAYRFNKIHFLENSNFLDAFTFKVK